MLHLENAIQLNFTRFISRISKIFNLNVVLNIRLDDGIKQIKKIYVDKSVIILIHEALCLFRSKLKLTMFETKFFVQNIL